MKIYLKSKSTWKIYGIREKRRRIGKNQKQKISNKNSPANSNCERPIAEVSPLNNWELSGKERAGAGKDLMGVPVVCGSVIVGVSMVMGVFVRHNCGR